MPRPKKLLDQLLDEIILYGGFPLRRRDVYQDALARTDSTKAADMFAFGPWMKKTDAEPMSLDEFHRYCGA